MVAAAGATVLEGEGGREADVVVVSGHRGFDYAELLTAKRALDRRRGAGRDQPRPDDADAGRRVARHRLDPRRGRNRLGEDGAEIGGKPEHHLFAMAIEVIRGSQGTDGVRKEPREGQLAMVGDRIASDIDGGRAAGLATVLVLSGTSNRAEAEAAEPAPDHVIENLAGLLR